MQIFTTGCQGVFVVKQDLCLLVSILVCMLSHVIFIVPWTQWLHEFITQCHMVRGIAVFKVVHYSSLTPFCFSAVSSKCLPGPPETHLVSISFTIKVESAENAIFHSFLLLTKCKQCAPSPLCNPLQ